jgi:hypothetical protein
MIAAYRYTVFSLVSTIVYVIAYYTPKPQLQAFRYYPLLNKISLDALPAKESGPAMLYYGWMATALIAGLVVALIVEVILRLIGPAKITVKPPAFLGWVVPLLLVAATLIYEKHWFL